jgi:hypothetical protein
MNEKITELAVQADLYARSDNCSMFFEIYQKRYTEKFAELMVKEISKIIVNGGYWSGGIVGEPRQCSPIEIAQMIEDYFRIVDE